MIMKMRKDLARFHNEGYKGLYNVSTQQVENIIDNSYNLLQIKDKITFIDDVINLTNKLHKSSRAFILGELGINGKISSVSITPEAFERKK